MKKVKVHINTKHGYAHGRVVAYLSLARLLRKGKMELLQNISEPISVAASIKRSSLAVIVLLLATFSHALMADTVTYVYTDPQGTVLAEANQNGAIGAQFDYTPYGSTFAGNGMMGARDGAGYTGHVVDADTSLVYMQARYFDPSLGRFLSEDPIGPSSGNYFNFNRFSYADNNPIANDDPNGQCTGSNVTDKYGNCADSGNTVTSSGPGTGGVVQTAIGAAKPLINFANSVFGALGDSEAASNPDLTPSNEDQAHGAIIGTIAVGALTSLPTEGRAAEVAAEDVVTITSSAARREAMRKAGIPTSQQPISQKMTPAGMQYVYEVPKPGGGTRRMVVTNQTTDRVPGHGPHWEAGPAKTPERLDPLGRIRVSNDKAKVEYGN
jgi:RHS repeat-associated protein